MPDSGKIGRHATAKAAAPRHIWRMLSPHRIVITRKWAHYSLGTPNVAHKKNGNGQADHPRGLHLLNLIPMKHAASIA